MNQNQNQNKLKCPKFLERWVRFPQEGQEEHCGLTRSMANKLAKQGLIITASVKVDGGTRGARLFWLPSIYDYIAQKANEQNKTTELLNGETEE